MSYLTQGATSLRKDLAFLPSIALEPLSCLIWQHLWLDPANNANISDIKVEHPDILHCIPHTLSLVHIFFIQVFSGRCSGTTAHYSSSSSWPTKQPSLFFVHLTGHTYYPACWPYQTSTDAYPPSQAPNLPLPMDPHVHRQHLVKAGVNGCTGWSSKPCIQWSHRT
jgi:hypothetical protein